MGKTASWTFMVFLAGDNSLSSAADKDIGEMRTVGSSHEVNVVVEVDHAGSDGTHRFHVRRDGVGEETSVLDETDSGDPETLEAFVSWAVERYPARHYALVLWNHGGGWQPTEIDRIALSVGAADYTGREVVERSASPLGRALFRTTLESVLRLNSAAERAICSDDGSGHSLDTLELGRVLGRITRRIGRPLDLLGMDACLMSNFEVAYQSAPFARFAVASVENEPADGWPYDRVLQALVGEPEISAEQLATHVVDVYAASYRERAFVGNVTQSALDLSRVGPLAEALDQLSDSLVEAMPSVAGAVWSAQRRSAHFCNNTLWDIEQFCAELERATEVEKVRTATGTVRAQLRPGNDRPIVAAARSGVKVEHCGGLSIYLLPPISPLSRFYADLDFAREHRWLAMLESYHASD